MRVGASIWTAAMLLLASCAPVQEGSGNVAAPASVASVETIDAATLAGMIARDEVVLVDVRTPEEFAEARIAGSLLAPIQTFLPASIPIETRRETILYCRSSGRSARAARMLADHTGKRVRHLEGGLKAWIAAGQPTIPVPEDAEGD